MALSKPGFLREAWSLAWPYWASDEKWAARGLLAAVVALNLTSVCFTTLCNSTTGRNSGGNSPSFA